MTPCIHALIQRAIAPLLLVSLVLSAAACFADPYSDVGTVYIAGTITDIQDQQICELYGCHIGSNWSLQMTFSAPHWNAPGTDYFFSDVLLNCFGGPPCIFGYHASSDFGWGPFGFDILSIEIEDGQVVDARAACNGYFVEWGEKNTWSYHIGFAGTTTGYADTTPEPASLITLGTGALAIVMKRISPMLRMM